MHSADIQDEIVIYVSNSTKNFNAPYGVLSGTVTDNNGRKYKSVTFGRARTLDVSVKIYNGSFIIVNTSRHGNRVFRNTDDLMTFLKTL